MISALLFIITSFCLSVCIITHAGLFGKHFVCICVYFYSQESFAAASASAKSSRLLRLRRLV